MTLTRYRLTIPDKQYENPHFELRIDYDNRPFHIAWRASSEALIINSMRSGAWNEETKVDIVSEEANSSPEFYIEIDDIDVRIICGRDIATFQLAAEYRDIPLHLDVSGMQYEAYAHSPAMANLRDQSSEGTGHVEFLGKILSFADKKDINPYKEDLINHNFSDNQKYLNFLGACPVSSQNLSLFVIDISKQSVVESIAAAILFPQVEVQVVRGDPVRDDFLENLFEANGIGNAKLVSYTPSLASLLQTGHVIVQGDDIFERLGEEIDALDPDLRLRLSICSGSSQPIPGNRIFPCANAAIRHGKHWVLRHNANISCVERRHGLDVVVSSFNAGDYLIECTNSLLSEGRDDIRVIIVDDGSTDGSGNKAAQVFANDPRVRVERKINGGCASARNYGRLISDATHIAFVDADDFVTPNFFSDLYDLSLYSGMEITQGGFDHYDETLDNPYYPSYEHGISDLHTNLDFSGHTVILLDSISIVEGQPTIWRKVYRRDFLDAKNIYFPENIRAYDDFIFHMLTLTEARNVLMMPDHLYHYRQHPAQDIRQGDERHFYMLQMFYTLVRQSLDNSWPNFVPYAQSIMNSTNWSAKKLKSEFVDSFLVSTARLAVVIRKIYGADVMSDALLETIEHPDFMFHFSAEWKRVEHLAAGTHWAYSSGPFEHPDLVRMRAALSAPQ